MYSVAQKLIAHWQSSGISIQPGVMERYIQEFESKYRVIMPPDMRGYFLQVDGMKMTLDDCKDKEGFSFWPLHRVKTAVEEMSQLTGAHYNLQELESFFVFADYFDWSWAYAIYLSSNLSAQNRVILIGKEIPIKIANSFTHFVDLYTANSPELYGDAE